MAASSMRKIRNTPAEPRTLAPPSAEARAARTFGAGASGRQASEDFIHEVMGAMALGGPEAQHADGWVSAPVSARAKDGSGFLPPADSTEAEGVEGMDEGDEASTEALNLFAQRVSTYGPSADLLTRPEEITLVQRWRKSNDRRAQDEILRRHEPLVSSCVARIMRCGVGAADHGRDDYLQAARMALTEALNSYDPNYGGKGGVRFGSYARTFIERRLAEERHRMSGTLQDRGKPERRIIDRHRRAISEWEKAEGERLGVPPSHASAIFSWGDPKATAWVAGRIGVSSKKLLEMAPRLQRRDSSLQQEIRTESGEACCLGDLIGDGGAGAEAMEATVLDGERKRVIAELIDEIGYERWQELIRVLLDHGGKGLDERETTKAAAGVFGLDTDSYRKMRDRMYARANDLVLRLMKVCPEDLL